MNLTEDEEEETKISPSSALQVAAKLLMLNSIFSKKIFVRRNYVQLVENTVSVPDRITLGNKNVQ